MTTSFDWLRWALLAFGLSACGNSSGSASFEQIKLPKGLREVSGLAVAPGPRILAMADEVGRVYSIEFSAGRISRVTGFGDPAVKADFEGLAVSEEWLYATTSDGELYRRSLASSDPASFEQFETDLGKRCEIEGLATYEGSGTLWFLCKEARKKKYKGKLVLFAWSTESQALRPSLDIQVPFGELGFKKAIAPSALEFTKSGREIWIVAAQQRVFVLIQNDGTLIRNGALPNRKWHPQTEGIAIVGPSIYLADEGGKGVGTLSRYANGF